MGKNVDIFCLTDSKLSLDEEEKGSKGIEDELKIVVLEQDILAISNLNKEQRYAYGMVLERVIKDKPSAFSLMGQVVQVKHIYIERFLLQLDQRDLLLLLLQHQDWLHLYYQVARQHTRD